MKGEKRTAADALGDRGRKTGMKEGGDLDSGKAK